MVLVSYEDSRGRIAARVKRMTPSWPGRIHIWPDPGPLFVGDDRGAAAPAPSWRGLWDAIRTIRPALGGPGVPEAIPARAGLLDPLLVAA